MNQKQTVVQNENYPGLNKMSYASYVTKQTRQFGKEISNVQNINEETQINYFQQQQKKIKVQKLQKQKEQIGMNQGKKALTQVSQQQGCLLAQRSNSVSQQYQSRPKSKHQSFIQFKKLESDTWVQEEFATKMDVENKEYSQPILVTMYVNEIFDYLRKQEKQYLPNPHYMINQKDITISMRSILIDWLVDVHYKFKLTEETLFLTVNLIDRFLSNNQVLRSKLQLVGVASMFIASKFEEIYAPEVKDFVYVCDKTYSKEDILEMESIIIQSVQFNLTYTSSYRFLERQCSGANLCERVTNSAKMILELALVEFKCIKFPPSLLSTTSIIFAINLLDSPQVLPTSLHFNQNSDELKQCIQELLLLIQNFPKSNLTAIKRKYSQEKYCQVSDQICNIINQQLKQ